jgi:putative protease
VPQPGLIARFADIAQMPDALPPRVERIVLPLAQWQQVPAHLRPLVWLEVPRALFGAAEEQAAEQIQASAAQGFGGYVAGNIAHAALLKGQPMMGDFSLNITNAYAVQAWKELGLQLVTASPELTAADVGRLGDALPTTALAYGHMPLMLTRACPLHNVHTCAGCSQAGELTDRKGMRFPVRCSGPAGVRTVYNPVPIYMGDKADQMPTDYLTLYFTLETQQEAAQAIRRFCAGAPWEDAFTRGLYFKGTN